jgi:shikimate dehydrogenase
MKMDLKVVGLVGKSLIHSHSPAIFKNIFERENKTGFQYQLFEVNEVSDIFNLIKNEPSIAGFNVTIPFKQSIIPFLDELDPLSEKLKAVNTVIIFRNGDKIHSKGYNTDYIGFKNSIKPLIKFNHEKALILGDGATSSTVSAVLRDIGLDVNIVSRKLSGKHIIPWNDINEWVIKFHKVIINTTPLGMFPDVDNFPPIPYKYIGSSHLIYDVIYNPEKTLFLDKCAKQGAQIENGRSMLHLQAEAAWQIWKTANAW